MLERIIEGLSAPAGRGPLMRGTPLWLLIVVVLAIVAILELGGVTSSSPPPADSQVPTAWHGVSALRFNVDHVAAMKGQLSAEPKIRDAIFRELGPVEWQIGVVADGTDQLGYARYVCGLLRDKGLVDPETDVRVVDLVKLEATKGDFRSASLGHADCSTGNSLGT